MFISGRVSGQKTCILFAFVRFLPVLGRIWPTILVKINMSADLNRFTPIFRSMVFVLPQAKISCASMRKAFMNYIFVINLKTINLSVSYDAAMFASHPFLIMFLIIYMIA